MFRMWSMLGVLGTAVIGLILVTIAVVVGSTVLIWNGNQVPDGLVALGAASVGALATLMTTAPKGNPPPE